MRRVLLIGVGAAGVVVATAHLAAADVYVIDTKGTLCAHIVSEADAVVVVSDC